MHVSNNADLVATVSRSASAEAICAALRLFIGRGRLYTVKQVQRGAGIKDRVIECAMVHPDHEEHRPLNVSALLSISKFLGPHFTNEWLGLTEQGAFHLPEGEPDPGEIAADIAEDNAALVRMAAHESYDGGDRQTASVVGARLVSRGQQLVAIGKRAA